MSDVRSQIHLHFAWLISELGFVVTELDQTHHVLRSPLVTFHIFTSPLDLPEFMWLDPQVDGSNLAYDLWVLLVRGRRDRISHLLKPVPDSLEIAERNSLMFAVFSESREYDERIGSPELNWDAHLSKRYADAG